MDSPSKFESLAIRFAPYLGDLHEYFVLSGMPFGSPEDVGAFVSAVALPGSFHDDLCSLLRSIIYRENKSINVMESVELLLVAVGGPHVDETAGDMRESVRLLLDFVREVYRSVQRGPVLEMIPVTSQVMIPETSDTRTVTPGPTLPIVAPAAVQAPESFGQLASETGDPLAFDAGDRAEPLAQLQPADVRMTSSSNVFMRARALAAELAPGHPAEDIPPGDLTDAAQQTPLADLGASTHGSPPVDLAVEQHESPAAVEPPSPKVPRRPLPEPLPSYRARRPSPFANRISSRRIAWSAALSVFALAAFGGILLHSRTGTSSATALSFSPSRARHVSAPAAPVATPGYREDASNGGTAEPSLAMPSDSTGAESQNPDQLAPAPSTSGRSRTTGSRGAPLTGNGGTRTPTPVSARPVGTPTVFASPEPLPKAIYAEPVGEAPGPAPGRSSRPERPLHYATNLRTRAIAVSSGVMAGNLLAAPAPEYPRFAKLTHTQGEVVIQAFVARDGSVMATHILRGPFMLRSAAEHAVRRWRYRPYMIDGRATEVATVVSVDFRLHP